jgi:hypothetical protein
MLIYTEGDFHSDWLNHFMVIHVLPLVQGTFVFMDFGQKPVHFFIAVFQDLFKVMSFPESLAQQFSVFLPLMTFKFKNFYLRSLDLAQINHHVHTWTNYKIVLSENLPYVFIP